MTHQDPESQKSSPARLQVAVPGTTRGPRGPGREQLALFSRAAEAERCLREERDSLGAAYGELQDRYETLWREARDLRQDLARARRQLDDCRRARDAALNNLTFWQGIAASWERQVDLLQALAGHAQAAPIPPTPDLLFKRLLALVHPDKWAQGQPATTLAHELTVLINHVRQGEALP